MTMLVTGAAGFLGRRVAEMLLAEGQAVRVLVRKPEQAEALRACGAGAVVGDVRDHAALHSAMRGVRVVYHCAAAVGPSYSAKDIYDVNLGGASNVLEVLREAGHGRAVLVSTINVYGICNLDNATEDLPCRRAKEASADVKIEMERMAREFREKHGVDVVILRPPLIYGPGEHNLPKILRTIRRKKFAYIGSRENLIPMVHVDDAARAMVLAGSTPAASGQTYHFSDGQRTTIREMVEHLAQLSGCEPPQKVLPYIIPAAACRLFEGLRRLRLMRGPGPINRTALRFLGTSRSLDISRARKELGYEPKIGFREGMAATVQWIQEHDQEPTHAPTSHARAASTASPAR